MNTLASFTAIDTLWMLVCACFVFFMQAGFTCYEAGLVQSKNVISVAIENIFNLTISIVLFSLVGFPMMFGETIFSADSSAETAFVFLQIMFAAVSVTIFAGALSERTKLAPLLVAGAVSAALIYPLFGRLAWGSHLSGNASWLEKLGFLDFAGASVVHMTAGFVALAGLLAVGFVAGILADLTSVLLEKLHIDDVVNVIPVHLIGGLTGILALPFCIPVSALPTDSRLEQFGVQIIGACICFAASFGISFFSYQQMFAILTPALITGAFADRVNFKSYLVFLVLWSLLIYIPLAHWVWGGGFLQQMGVVDFAGGIVVHASAGLAALASVFFVGKRTVVSKVEMEPHNVTHVALGTALLWFGWFGFNAGGALGANSLAATAFINTDLGASAAMVTWLIISWIREKSPSFVGVLTGAVAGLATITPGAGFVKPWAAIIIGVLAGIICYAAVQFRKKLDWDDALDVWGVHGVGGIIGTILLGIFASKDVNGISGLIEGDVHQFGIQIFGTLLASAYAFVITMLILKVVNKFLPVRVTPEEERIGLDASLHHEEAYHL